MALCVAMGKDVVAFPKCSQFLLAKKETIKRSKDFNEIYEALSFATDDLVDRRNNYSYLVFERNQTKVMQSNTTYTIWVDRVTAVVEEIEELKIMCTKRKRVVCFGSMSHSNVVKKMKEVSFRVFALLEEADMVVIDVLVDNLVGKNARKFTIT